jgi:hypothetical protein
MYSSDDIKKHSQSLPSLRLGENNPDLSLNFNKIRTVI